MPFTHRAPSISGCFSEQYLRFFPDPLSNCLAVVSYKNSLLAPCLLPASFVLFCRCFAFEEDYFIKKFKSLARYVGAAPAQADVPPFLVVVVVSS